MRRMMIFSNLEEEKEYSFVRTKSNNKWNVETVMRLYFVKCFSLVSVLNTSINSTTDS